MLLATAARAGPRRSIHLDLTVEQPPVLLLEHRQDQVLLRPEVVMDSRKRDFGELGNPCGGELGVRPQRGRGVGPKTVEFHLGNGYRKLALHSHSQLLRIIEGI